MIKTGVKGEYLVEVLDSTGEVKKSLKFDNLITDFGLEKLAGDGSNKSYVYFDKCYLGSSTTAPVYTNSGMYSYIVGIYKERSDGNLTYYRDDLPSRIEAISIYQWNTGELGHITFREIGVGKSSSKLLSHSQLKDQNGNPTSLEILETDGLRITYKLTIYLFCNYGESIPFSVNGYTGTLSIYGSNSSYSKTWNYHYNFLGHGKGLLGLTGFYAGSTTINAVNITIDRTNPTAQINTVKIPAGTLTTLSSFRVKADNQFPLIEITFDTPITLSDTEEFKIVLKRSLVRV